MSLRSPRAHGNRELSNASITPEIIGGETEKSLRMRKVGWERVPRRCGDGGGQERADKQRMEHFIEQFLLSVDGYLNKSSISFNELLPNIRANIRFQSSFVEAACVEGGRHRLMSS